MARLERAMREAEKDTRMIMMMMVMMRKTIPTNQHEIISIYRADFRRINYLISL